MSLDAMKARTLGLEDANERLARLVAEVTSFVTKIQRGTAAKGDNTVVVPSSERRPPTRPRPASRRARAFRGLPGPAAGPARSAAWASRQGTE
jgi:hypothetical protein